MYFTSGDGDQGSTGKKSPSVKSEGKNSVSAFGSVTATLMDGMNVALSQFGPSGESSSGKKYEPEPYVPPPTSPSPGPPPSPAKSKKGEKKAPTPEPVQTTTVSHIELVLSVFQDFREGGVF